MRFSSLAALKAALVPQWKELRALRRFPQDYLPSIRTSQWVAPEGDRVGWVTLDYSLHEDVVIPAGFGWSGDLVIDLVEVYWSVRTRNGPQDPRWEPSLNVNAILLCHETATLEDCEKSYRAGIGLNAASVMALRAAHGEYEKRLRLYVRALVLTPMMTPALATLHAFGTRLAPPLSVLSFDLTPTKGFVFEVPPDSDRLFEVGVPDTDRIRDLGKTFLDGATLSGPAFTWPGTNDGPVWDGKIGLSIHEGRVIDDAT